MATLEYIYSIKTAKEKAKKRHRTPRTQQLVLCAWTRHATHYWYLWEGSAHLRRQTRTRKKKRGGKRTTGAQKCYTIAFDRLHHHDDSFQNCHVIDLQCSYYCIPTGGPLTLPAPSWLPLMTSRRENSATGDISTFQR